MPRKAKKDQDRESRVAQFVERFALVVTQSGVPRMSARVFVALLASDDGALTAEELATRLSVSRAAISGAVAYLDQVGLLTRDRVPGQKVDHYRVDSRTSFESFARRDEILLKWEGALAEGVRALGLRSTAGARLDEMQRFFAFLRGELPRIIEKWRRLEARSTRNEGAS